MRRTLSLAALGLACLLALCFGGCGEEKKTAEVTREAFESEELQFAGPREGDTVALFETTAGDIYAVLYPDEAPMAVENFIGLANDGYYDGLPFHRVVYGFVAQSGDGSGTGLSGATIWHNNPYPLECSDRLHHYSGALCMARSAEEEDTCLSQYYFVQSLPQLSKDLKEALEESGFRQEVIDAYNAVGGLPYLDNHYTVFGQVYQGMEVVDAIGAAETDENDVPLEEITVLSVSISTYTAAQDNAGAESQP